VALTVSVRAQATFASTLVDEWVRAGVTDAVICPGSRSTPMAVALAARLRIHVRLDERSAGFFALGLSMANRRPTVICVTSGTAVAELHPAVVEAHQGRVPLIVCTADRPPELHHVGAPQTIDQVGLFTTSTRWAVDPGVPEESAARTWRPLAARAVAEAQAGPLGPGPVHLNLAFREPLVGEPGPLPVGRGPALVGPVDAVGAVSPMARVAPLSEPLRGRGLLIAGAHATSDPAHLLLLGTRLGWPVLADPRSGCRVYGTIAAADAIVRTTPALPETIVLLGAPWLSKALNEYVVAAAEGGARVIGVDPWWQWTDPSAVVAEFHRVSGDSFIAAALAAHDDVAVASGATRVDLAWLETWQAHEKAAQAAIEHALGSELSEPRVARTLARYASADEVMLMVSASMPMRDLEWYAQTFDEPPTVMANRGANGIDGVVSTALGIAASGRQTIALLGDLAFLHDVSGLVNMPDLPCTFVVVDNAGGGIFSFLPQATTFDGPQFELLFGTPPTSDVADVARGFGLAVHEVTTVGELEHALEATALAGSPALIRARVRSRTDNVALHEAINEAVRRAITEATPGQPGP
jgi:2-succinyl-5-enolpyruvyl-6-hydroxy-3-cyclohexene-1-carboxylate synthase